MADTLLVASDLSLTLGGKPLFDSLSFHIEAGDRIALLGPNGSGKSSLFRILAGSHQPDSGSLQWTQGVRVGHLSQVLPEGQKRAVIDYVLRSIPGRDTVENSLEQARTRLESLEVRPADMSEEAHVEALMDAATVLSELEEQRLALETDYSEHKAEEILTGLGFRDSDLRKPLDAFSGGWRMRAYFASLLLQSPDLLLLDEPTNHLDMPSVAWFSSFLKRYRGAFIVISHDPEFIEEQATRIISYEPEGVRQFTGRLGAYRTQREVEREHIIERAKNLEKERKHHEEFIARFRAKASKAAAVQSRVKALEKMETPVELQSRRRFKFRFPEAAPSHRKVIATESLGKSYGDHLVLENVTLEIERGDRICIAGVNGAGKSTLLRQLAGVDAPTTGDTQLGGKVTLGYFAQEHLETLNQASTAYEEVKHTGKDCSETQIRGALGVLGFIGDEMDKPVSVLSGGERARVALAKLLVTRANLLVLDEPTNHLDLESSESLAEALASYEGTLLFVSHNRAFARTLASKILHIEDHKVSTFRGTFDEYLKQFTGDDSGKATLSSQGSPSGERQDDKKHSDKKHKAAAKPIETPHTDKTKATRKERAERRKLVSKKLRPVEKRAQEVEAQIAELEALQEERNEKLCDPQLQKDPKQRDSMLWSFQADAAKLTDLMEEWGTLEEQLEQIRRELGENTTDGEASGGSEA